MDVASIRPNQKDKNFFYAYDNEKRFYFEEI